MNVPHSLILEQKENAKHGEVFFPIQKYITKLTSDSPVIMTHWHEEAELTLITKGSCIYQIDLIDYEVNEGDLLFIPPLLLHSIRHNGTADFCSETYVFHVNFLGGNTTDICSTRYLTPIINHELSVPYHIPSTHPVYPSLCECFTKITSLYTEQGFGYEIALKSFLLQALFLLLQYSNPESATVSASSDKLKNVLDYIDLHYAEALSISELAELCYFSPVNDAQLPEDTDGIYLGGGYPETYRKELAENLSMKESICGAVKEGKPIIAECGGFMYVCNHLVETDDSSLEMLGLIDIDVHMTKRLSMQFGYVTLNALYDTAFFKKNMNIRAHEFHYSKADKRGDSCEIKKYSGKCWNGLYVKDNIMAGYPHFYFHNCKDVAEHFVELAEKAVKQK